MKKNKSLKNKLVQTKKKKKAKRWIFRGNRFYSQGIDIFKERFSLKEKKKMNMIFVRSQNIY